MIRSLMMGIIVLGAIAFLARPAAARAGPDPQQPGDTLYAKPHDVFPEELMRQMPRGNSRGVQRSPFASPAGLYPNVNISVDTFPQNEPSVRISRKHPNRVVAAWRDFRTGVSPAIRRVGYSLSTDGGATWAASALLPVIDPVHARASDPAVGVDTAGNFYITTISVNNTNNDGKIFVYRSTDEGLTFDTADVAPTVPGVAFDDKEYIISDLNPGSPFANTLYITWTRFGTPGGIRLTRSTDAGHTWSPSVQVSDGTSVQGSDPAIGPNGEVYVVWAGAGVSFDKSTDGGASFGVDSVISPNGGLHGFPSIGVDLSSGVRRGTIYVTWSDSRNVDDDVFLSVSTNGGQSWSSPKRVNDDPPHNSKLQYWPWLAVDDQGTVAIVYYDTRNTPDNSIFEAYLARSFDGGQTFTNQLLSSQQSASNTPNADVRFGDYIGIDAWYGHTVPVWTDERAGGFNMDIYSAVIQAPHPGVIPVSVSAGWNLVSLPAVPGDPVLSTVFPTSTSPAFSYAGSYLINDTLKNGTGYWLKFGSDQTVHVSGDSVALDSIQAFSQWNLIGSISAPVPVSTIGSDPGGIIVSRYFGYSSGYQVVDTIKPGSACWVKTLSAGRLILAHSFTKQSIALSGQDDLGSLNQITFSDESGSGQTLYFGTATGQIDPRRYELPPVPPGDALDARFNSQRMLELSPRGESALIPIALSGASYPMTISWKVRTGAAALLAGGKEIPLEREGTTRTLHPASSLRLRFSPDAIAELPRETRLEQNYPNPFNPTTTLSFVIGSAGGGSFVRLGIYDLLGREVTTLVNERKLPGRYRVEWNAGGLPTGLYVYRLTAGASAQSRAMALIR